jgi:hypothetical protein
MILDVDDAGRDGSQEILARLAGKMFGSSNCVMANNRINSRQKNCRTFYQSKITPHDEAFFVSDYGNAVYQACGSGLKSFVM